MAEDLNAEIAGGLAEASESPPATGSRWERTVEILEAVVLAVVAVATAWSGYQAARWDGRQSELYAQASATRVQADQLLTLGGQQKLLDVTTFNTWITAKVNHHEDLPAFYERRFSQEFKVAFDAWIAEDPLSNPDAPPGPSYMPECHNSQIEQGTQLNEQAAQMLEAGTAARNVSDNYIRTTVVLASVLFLLAIAQRFRVRGVRIGVLVVSGGLLVYGVVALATFRRL